MNDVRGSLEQIRAGLLRMRPIIRPYLVTALWIAVGLSIGWDVKRYLSGNPQSVATAAPFYLITFGILLFDHIVERRLRRSRNRTR